MPPSKPWSGFRLSAGGAAAKSLKSDSARAAWRKTTSQSTNASFNMSPLARSKAWEKPVDVIEVDSQYYILAKSSMADDRTRVLKHGDAFAVFDRYGDIQPVGMGEQGVYQRGTRFLSR